MNPKLADRVLHVAETRHDIETACRAAAECGGSSRAHWILTSIAPDPATPLPIGTEWIRLPAGGTSVWRQAFGGLVEALSPEVVNLYPGFVAGSNGRLAWLRSHAVSERLHVVTPSGHDPAPPRADGPMRIGYVLKRFPRYSETFILRELLALEDLGFSVQTFSVRPPREGRFHASLARLKHVTEYLSEKPASKRLPTLLRELPATPMERDRVAGLFWECVDRDDPLLLQYLVTALDVASRAKAAGITHLHAHFGTSACEITRFAATIADIGYSFTVHAKDIYMDDVDRIGLDLKFRDCRFAVTVCDANERFLHEAHPLSRGKLVRIYNGLDVARHDLARAAERSVPHILAVGRFVEKKGFGLLLDALHLLRSRGKVFTAELIGDGELADALLARRDELRLADCVSLPGSRSSEQVQEAMADATLLACPCIVAESGDKDALPTVLLEALAAGLPCVSTDVGGIREILDDGRAGLIVSATVEGVADGIETLLDDPTTRHRLAERGRARAREEFDIHRNVRRLAACFVAGTPVSHAETLEARPA